MGVPAVAYLIDALLPLRSALSFKTVESNRANLLRQRLLHQCSFACLQTTAVRRAYYRRDFTLRTNQIFGSALFPWHRETGRAGNVNTKVHNHSSGQASWAGSHRARAFLALFRITSAAARTA